MQTIILTLETTTIVLNTHEVKGQTLYKAQDLLTGYGYDSKKSSDTVRNWLKSIEKKALRKMNVTVLQGGTVQGTYLTQRQIYKLAGYVSYEFEDAVYEAFELLSEGKVEEAVEVVNRVCVHELMFSARPKREIVKMYKASGLSIDEFTAKFLTSSMNNTKARLEDRNRLANSLKAVIDNSYDALSAREISQAAAHEKALRLVAEYTREKRTQVASRNKTTIHGKAIKALEVAKSNYHKAKELQAKNEKLQTNLVKAVGIAKQERQHNKELTVKVQMPF